MESMSLDRSGDGALLNLSLMYSNIPAAFESSSTAELTLSLLSTLAAS